MLGEQEGASSVLTRRLAGSPLSARPALGRLAFLGLSALLLGLVARACTLPGSLPIDTVLLDWAPAAGAPVAYAYHLDGLGLFFVGLAALAALVLLSLWPDVKEAPGARELALTAAGFFSLLGILIAGDLVILYICWTALGFACSMTERAVGADASPAGDAIGHLTGIGLLGAALILGGQSGGVFAVGAVEPAAVAGAVPGLLLIAALGRLAQAWDGPGARAAPARELTSSFLVISSAYLLLRGLDLAGYAWTPRWSAALVAGGAALAIVGALDAPLAGPRRLARHLGWVDAGLLLMGLGLGGALALASCLLLAISLVLSRLPLALSSGEDTDFGIADHHAEPAEESTLSVGLTLLTIAGLPPLIGFAARAALVGAAWERGLWLAVAAGVFASALAFRAALAGTARAAGAPRAPALELDKPADKPTSGRHSRPRGQRSRRIVFELASSLGANWRLGLAAAPLLALCLVPTLPALAIAPALLAVPADWVVAQTSIGGPGTRWPVLAVALLGPGLGAVAHAAGWLGGRSRAQAITRASQCATPALGCWEPIWRGLTQASLAAARWSGQLEGRWHAAVVLGAMAAIAAVLALWR